MENASDFGLSRPLCAHPISSQTRQLRVFPRPGTTLRSRRIYRDPPPQRCIRCSLRYDLPQRGPGGKALYISDGSTSATMPPSASVSKPGAPLCRNLYRTLPIEFGRRVNEFPSGARHMSHHFTVSHTEALLAARAFGAPWIVRAVSSIASGNDQNAVASTQLLNSGQCDAPALPGLLGELRDYLDIYHPGT